jgi:hypothetical protein
VIDPVSAAGKLREAKGAIFLSVSTPGGGVGKQAYKKSGCLQLLALLYRTLLLQLRQGIPPPTVFLFYLPLVCVVIALPVISMLLIDAAQACARLAIPSDPYHCTTCCKCLGSTTPKPILFSA